MPAAACPSPHSPTLPLAGDVNAQRVHFWLLLLLVFCQVLKVVQGTEHRPFNPKSDAHQTFLRKQLQKVDNLERKYPLLNLDDERRRFEAQILEPVAASGH